MRCGHPITITPNMVRGEVTQLHCPDCGVTHQLRVTEGAVTLTALRDDVVAAMTNYGLSRNEGRLFALLACRPGKTVSHKELLRLVWGEMYNNPRLDGHLVRVNMSRLHAKIRAAKAPWTLHNVPGVGYWLEAVSTAEQVAA